MRVELANAPAIGTTAPDKKGKAAEAAAQFEALILAQLLQSTCAAGGLAGLDGEQPQDDAVSGFAAHQLGQALANAGGLGLARLVADGLVQPATGSAVPALDGRELPAAPPTPRS